MKAKATLSHEAGNEKEAEGERLKKVKQRDSESEKNAYMTGLARKLEEKEAALESRLGELQEALQEAAREQKAQEEAKG